tara:strand:- start:137 stop:328 length:192 start_codon:yes stop_codon:yes gene_type:complete
MKSERKKLQDEWQSKKYQVQRREEYPSLEDLIVALIEDKEGNSDMLDTIKAKRQVVKDKYPKP